MGQKTGALLQAVTNQSSPDLDPHQAGEATDLQGPETKTETQVLSLFWLPWWLRRQCLPAMRETHVRFLSWEDPLEKEMAIHSSTLAWKIPWTEEPDRLQSMGLQRVRHDD